jgi:hypothetical protein
VLEIQQLQAIAITAGFERTRVLGNGTTLWLRNVPCEHGTELLMCIDTVTQSATIFWEEENHPMRKTFRKAQEMCAWLQSACAVRR